MMSGRFIKFLFVILVSAQDVHPWFLWSRNRTINAVAPVTPRCLIDAQAGRCAFYACLESRFPCRRNNFATHYGLYYCNKYENLRSSFNWQGKRWLSRMQACQTQRFREIYRSNTTTCQTMANLGFRQISTCYSQAGLCDIAWQNRRVLWRVFDIMDFTDRIHSLRLWGEVVDVMRDCAGIHARRLVTLARIGLST